MAEQREHLFAIPTAEFLRLGNVRRGDHRARDQSIAHGGIEIAPPRAQAAEVKRPAFARGDDVGRGARTLRFRKLDFVGHPERGGDAGERGLRLRGRAGTKIAAGDGDAQAFAAAREQRRGRLHRTLRADRIVVIVTLHRVIGEREIARAARQRSDVIEACNEGKRVGAGKPAVGRLQAENPAERGRHADRAVGIGAERDRHEAAGDRAARAAGGAARHPADVVGIARGAVVDVLAGEVVGIFTHIERPHEHGAVGF